MKTYTISVRYLKKRTVLHHRNTENSLDIKEKYIINIGGAVGTSHGKDYGIADHELACVSNAKFQLMILKKLLENNAVIAKNIIEEAKPPFPSKQAYLDYIDSLNSSSERIRYLEDGTASVTL